MFALMIIHQAKAIVLGKLMMIMNQEKYALVIILFIFGKEKDMKLKI